MEVFEQAVLDSGKKQWLGDYKTINRLLRLFAKQATESKAEKGEEFAKEVDKSAHEIADVLLGKDERFPGPKWNSPGLIDAHCAKWEGVDESSPEDRVAGALVNMIIQLRELGDSMGNVNALPEQWQFQVTAIIDSFVRLFLGLPRN